MLHMLNCLALCLSPHAIYFFATDLSDHDALASATHGALAYFLTAIAKAVLAVLYTPTSTDALVWHRVAVAAAISLADVAGLWYALTRLQHRNISAAHKAQAVGLGWAASDALLVRTVPIVTGAMAAAEFTGAHIASAIGANIYLVHMLSMAAAGVLFWGRQKSKTQSVRALLRLLMLVHAAVPAVISVLEQLQQLSTPHAVALQAGCTVLLAATSVTLWRQCNVKPS